MKKIIAMMVLVVSLVALLVSCGKFTCMMCGEEKSDSEASDLVEIQEGEVAGETYRIGICAECAGQ